LAELYGVLTRIPTKPDEFSSDHEQFAWDAEGWEHLG
jgi:hypothetical protein